MPYLALHVGDVPDVTLPDGRPLVRNVPVQGVSRSVLCGGFVRNEAIGNAQGAVVRYVRDVGGLASDWELRWLSPAEYDAVEAAVYGPVRAAQQTAEGARRQELRNRLAAQIVTRGSVASGDLVFRVPAAAADRKEFFKSLLLTLDEVREKMLEKEA